MMRAPLTVLLLITLAACGAGGGAGPIAPSASPSSTSKPTPTPLANAVFFPLAAGDTWTYSEQPLSGCDPTSQTVIDTIVSVSRGADGSLTAIDNLSGTAYPSGNNPGPETFTVKPDGSVQTGLPANPTLAYYPPADVIRSGQTVPIQPGRGNAMSARAHGAGVVSVSVPAGTFMAQVLVVDTTYPGPLPIPGTSGTPAPPQVSTTTFWLVAGVGLVKQTDSTGTENGVACTDVLQLGQYHVAP